MTLEPSKRSCALFRPSHAERIGSAGPGGHTPDIRTFGRVASFACLCPWERGACVVVCMAVCVSDMKLRTVSTVVSMQLAQAIAVVTRYLRPGIDGVIVR